MADAPANIAWIKYMGKAQTNGNIPLHDSLSYTLPHCVTRVAVYEATEGEDQWVAPVWGDPWLVPELSPQAQSRFLAHVARLKLACGVDVPLTIASASNFPADCGLASSASSFAALTRAVCQAWVGAGKMASPPLDF